jgi:Lrp/AsnC family transcriptional regulator, regulator for asnA, asnC and gidA
MAKKKSNENNNANDKEAFAVVADEVGQNENGHTGSNHRTRRQRMDELDLQIIDLLFAGNSSRQCAAILGKPVSTTQRRVRLLIQRGILRPTFELGYSELGLKRGFLHIYLEDGSIQDVTSKLLLRDGIYSVGVHLGNSDIVGRFVYGTSRDVLGLIGWAKELDGVDRVMWSEEVYDMSASPNLSNIFNNRG